MSPMTAIELLAVVFLGLVLGSFASALIWRIPRNKPWIVEKNKDNKRIFSRSACPHCHHELAARDLVPILSWLWLNGKCRYCGKAIAADYPVAEMLSVLACIGIYFVWGFTGQGFFLFAAVPFLTALLVIDIRHTILPNILNFILAAIAALFLLYQILIYGAAYGYDGILWGKIGGFIIFPLIAIGTEQIMTRVLKKESMGFGDVKFFAAAGLWLGLAYLPFFLIFSGIAGVLTGVVYRLRCNSERFPFGPALIIALYAGLLLQGLEINPFM